MSFITPWLQITNSTGAETSPTVHDPPAVLTLPTSRAAAAAGTAHRLTSHDWSTLPTSCAAAAATAHPSTFHIGSVRCYVQHPHVRVVCE